MIIKVDSILDIETAKKLYKYIHENFALQEIFLRIRYYECVCEKSSAFITFSKDSKYDRGCIEVKLNNDDLLCLKCKKLEPIIKKFDKYDTEARIEYHLAEFSCNDDLEMKIRKFIREKVESMISFIVIPDVSVYTNPIPKSPLKEIVCEITCKLRQVELLEDIVMALKNLKKVIKDRVCIELLEEVI